MTTPFSRLRKRWNEDPEFRKAYERASDEMEIAFPIAEARHRANLTQAQLAERLHTSQPTIARWESGQQKPRRRSLEKIAEATGSRIRIVIEPAHAS